MPPRRDKIYNNRAEQQKAYRARVAESGNVDLTLANEARCFHEQLLQTDKRELLGSSPLETLRKVRQFVLPEGNNG